MDPAKDCGASSTSTNPPNRKAIPFIKDKSKVKQVDSIRKALESKKNEWRLLIKSIKDEAHKRFLHNITARTISKPKILEVIDALTDPKKYHTQAICGVMPIFLAVQAQNTEVVRLLLKKSDNDDIGINHTYNINGMMYTPLSIALYSQNKDIIQLLLAHKEIDVNGPDELLSPLLIAFEQDDIDSLRLLTKNKNLKITGNYAYVLTKAVIWGKEEMLEVLLKEASARNKQHAILNKHYCDFVDSPKNKKHDLPIFIAIDSGFSKILALLLKYGAEIKNKYDNNVTPLICAIKNGSLDIVKILIDYGASVSEVDREYKCTPLYYALSYFNAPIAQAIIEAKKAEWYTADDQKRGRIWDRSLEYYELWYTGFVPRLLAPLMIRYYNCRLNESDKAFIQHACISILTAIDIFNMREKYRKLMGLDPYEILMFDPRYYRHADMTISDLLMEVLKKYAPKPGIDKNQDLGHDVDEYILNIILSPIVEFNFKAGSIADIKLAEGRTFLSYLSEYGATHFVEKILSHTTISKEHIDLASDDGRTPLAYAVINNHFTIVKQLVAKGANIHAIDKQGNSILYYALHKDCMDDNIMAQCILQLLVNKKQALSQSIAGLKLSQYNQLLKFILRRPEVNELLPIMQLSRRLIQILNTEENDVDSLQLIDIIRMAALKESNRNAWISELNCPTSNKQNKQHETALLLAIKKEHIPLVDALLAHQIYDESLLQNWKEWFASTCTSKNIAILELLIKRLHGCNAQDIIPTLLTEPLDRGNNKTALFYAIDAHKQAVGEDSDPFISYLTAHGAKLNQKLGGTKLTPLLYGLQVSATLSVLQPLITKESLQDVDSFKCGVLWYAVTYKHPSIVVNYIVKQLQQHNITLKEICRVVDLNENQSIHDCLEAYCMYTSNNGAGYLSDDNDANEPEIIWEDNNQSARKRSSSEYTDLCLKADGPKVDRVISWTQHVQDRAKQRKISEEQIVSLLNKSNKKFKSKYIITLRKGIIDGRNLCVVTGETNSQIFIITTYWIKDKKSRY